jgi:hypothetical protein
MKCKFCEKEKYIQRLNFKGVLEAHRTECIAIVKENRGSNEIN